MRGTSIMAERTRLMRQNAGAFIERRGFLKMAGAAAAYTAFRAVEYTATEAFTRAVVDPALAERPTGPHFATPVSLEAVKASAPDSAVRIAAEAWQEKKSVEHVIHALRKAGQDARYTLAGADTAGRLCVTRQGAGSRRLWGYSVEGMPMGARPDNPALGMFLQERYQKVTGDPLLENVVLFPTSPDLPGKFRYVGFAASDGKQIIGVTMPSDPAPIESSDRGPARREPSVRRMIGRQPANRPLSISA